MFPVLGREGESQGDRAIMPGWVKGLERHWHSSQWELELETGEPRILPIGERLRGEENKDVWGRGGRLGSSDLSGMCERRKE